MTSCFAFLLKMCYFTAEVVFCGKLMEYMCCRMFCNIISNLQKMLFFVHWFSYVELPPRTSADVIPQFQVIDKDPLPLAHTNDTLSTFKPGFHYPSSRAELTARELGCIF